MTMSSWMISASAMFANIGHKRLLSSPDAGRLPIVRRLYRIGLSPARNTVSGLDSADNSNWWYAVRKSSFVKIRLPANIWRISSTREMGKCVFSMALFTWHKSTVMQREPSGFGTSTGLEIHVTGPVCSSMTPSFSMACMHF